MFVCSPTTQCRATAVQVLEDEGEYTVEPYTALLLIPLLAVVQGTLLYPAWETARSGQNQRSTSWVRWREGGRLG